MKESNFMAIGNHIALQEKYVGLEGKEAIYRFLVDKYHWLPDQVRQLSNEDLNLLMAGYQEKATTDWD